MHHDDRVPQIAHLIYCSSRVKKRKKKTSDIFLYLKSTSHHSLLATSCPLPLLLLVTDFAYLIPTSAALNTMLKTSTSQHAPSQTLTHNLRRRGAPQKATRKPENLYTIDFLRDPFEWQNHIPRLRAHIAAQEHIAEIKLRQCPYPDPVQRVARQPKQRTLLLIFNEAHPV